MFQEFQGMRNRVIQDRNQAEQAFWKAHPWLETATFCVTVVVVTVAVVAIVVGTVWYIWHVPRHYWLGWGPGGPPQWLWWWLPAWARPN